ncbi:MAG: enoyl-CoA hydratase/isomerase family protein [Gammaproteobacteria bacterium]|nr:enoyl-CoA hydratase/isomerase family protein [Gammaproteobacteria bacterium]
MMNDIVRLDIDNDIAFIYMDGPNGNIMNNDWFVGFNKVMGQLSYHEIRGLVITGASRNFSSGIDFKTLHESLDRNNNTFFDYSNVYKSVEYIRSLHFKKYPVVAAIKRMCIGSGFELALACHYRVCDKTANLGSVEVDFGMMPGVGASVRLPRLIDRGRALELIMTGRMYKSETALNLGVIDMIVPPSELLSTAISFIDKINPDNKLPG